MLSARLFHARAGRIKGMDTGRYWLRVERACLVTCLLLIANLFISTGYMTSWLGGDGWTGHVVDGHYYLGSHGQYTETSPAVYEYTRMHVTFNAVTLPITVITGIAAGELRRRRLKSAA